METPAPSIENGTVIQSPARKPFYPDYQQLQKLVIHICPKQKCLWNTRTWGGSEGDDL